MEATFVMNVSDLDNNFGEAVKKAFGNASRIRISVEAETDETEYVEKFQEESIRKAEQELKEGKFISFNSTEEIKKWLYKETETLIN
jgi:hypothetical protein